METLAILVQSGRKRIIQHEDGSLAPQTLDKGSWQYEYYQDGLPVVVPNTDAGREECEHWAGLWVNMSLNPGLKKNHGPLPCSVLPDDFLNTH